MTKLKEKEFFKNGYAFEHACAEVWKKETVRAFLRRELLFSQKHDKIIPQPYGLRLYKVYQTGMLKGE